VYARQALRGIAAEIRETPPNTRRNECLNAGAYRMGRMVASGWIDKADVADELSAAAIANGLDIDEVQRTLASGLTAGMQQSAADSYKPRVRVNGMQTAKAVQLQPQSIGPTPCRCPRACCP